MSGACVDAQTASSRVDRLEIEVFTRPGEQRKVHGLATPRRRIVMKFVSASSKSMQEYQLLDERIVSHVHPVVRWA